MSLVEERPVHQALFGYADGHRLLESSTRFSSRDLYDLSAISDLATGVQLRPGESYLTGTMLEESRGYALIRTWMAPEMPRPGCVWSHALILPPEILVSQRDLSSLNGLFARPQSRDLIGDYARALDLPQHDEPREIPSDFVAHVVNSYYAGGLFGDELPTGPALDNAVLAVWSQQWPRLRALFSFRTIRTGSGHSRGGTRFDFQPGMRPDLIDGIPPSGNGRDLDWIDAAVTDAVSLEVTPLRRFLWRYGKDVRLPKQHFQNLVKIYLATRSIKPNSLPTAWAESIVSLFPGPDNAATLKRDMLGIEPLPLALCPAVAYEDTLELLSKLISDGTTVTDEALELRLTNAGAAEVPALATSFERHASELGEQSRVVMRTLTRIADDQTVADTRVPRAVRRLILQDRPDLIGARSLSATTDDDLLTLIDVVENDIVRTKILEAVVRRDILEYPDALVQRHAGELLLLAMTARSEGALSHGATAVLRRRAREFISAGALDAIAGTEMAAQAVDLLNYPVDQELSGDVQKWLSVLERPGMAAKGQYRVNLEAYMYVVAIKSRISQAWDLLKRTLPGLRSVVLAGGLVNPAYELLDVQLPPDGWNSWDFHKRILIGLRELARHTGAGYPVVSGLGLSDDDVNFILDRRKRKNDKGGSLFWFWD